MSLGPTKRILRFIGVSTGRSSIIKVFPRWADALGLGACEIRGVDLPPHADAQAYRDVVSEIKRDELSVGALVTTHKLDLLRACRDLFDHLDDYAQLMGEVSCISRREGRLVGRALDPITSGLALEAFLPKDHWRRTGAEAVLLGAGGSSVAITAYLLKQEHGQNRPGRIVVTDRRLPRLREIRRVHEKLAADVPCEYRHCPEPGDNDRAIAACRPHSLVINAIGLGKDAPGSPVTDRVRFPVGGYAWDFNYRGDLAFLERARAQSEQRNLHVEDGWTYFIHA